MKLKRNLIEILIFRQLPVTNIIAKGNAMALNNIQGKCQKSSVHSRLPVKAQITILKIATRTRDPYSMLPSIRTLETKTQFLRRPFQFSVNEVFRMKAEHFSFKMKVLAI